MGYFIFKAMVSGLLIAAISEIGRRSAGFAALVASLPLISLIGMIWLWRDTGDAQRLADHSMATMFYVIPSLPMFALIPVMLRSGFGFWSSLLAGCVLTVLLYLALVLIAARFGLRL